MIWVDCHAQGSCNLDIERGKKKVMLVLLLMIKVLMTTTKSGKVVSQQIIL